MSNVKRITLTINGAVRQTLSGIDPDSVKVGYFGEKEKVEVSVRSLLDHYLLTATAGIERVDEETGKVVKVTVPTVTVTAASPAAPKIKVKKATNKGLPSPSRLGYVLTPKGEEIIRDERYRDTLTGIVCRSVRIAAKKGSGPKDRETMLRFITKVTDGKTKQTAEKIFGFHARDAKERGWIAVA